MELTLFSSLSFLFLLLIKAKVLVNYFTSFRSLKKQQCKWNDKLPKAVSLRGEDGHRQQRREAGPKARPGDSPSAVSIATGTATVLPLVLLRHSSQAGPDFYSSSTISWLLGLGQVMIPLWASVVSPVKGG